MPTATTSLHRPPLSRGVLLVVMAVAVIGAMGLSVGVGAHSMRLTDLLSEATRDQAMQVLVVSRLPRTAALALAGATAAVAGVLTQLLVRNRLVEPSTVGTTESAGLALVLLALLAPGAPIMARMVVAAVGSLAGTAVFVTVLRRLPYRATLLVPVVGLMVSSVIGAASAFLAYRFDLLQSLGGWLRGDFSRVLAGRYELLWIGGALAMACYLLADRWTVVGLGRDQATNLGVSYGRLVMLGVTMVAIITAVTVVTVGAIPFVGLVIPNLVRLRVGDNMRRALPWTAGWGAVFALVCDVAGRLIIAPLEVPLVAVAGVVGSAAFLFLLLRPVRK